jgi:hypothetical protein
MKENGIGKNTTMSSQIIAQAKVLAFMASSAMQTITDVQKQMEKEGKEKE